MKRGCHDIDRIQPSAGPDYRMLMRVMRRGHFFCRNTSGSMPACLRMARSVPSGISPGWLGMVV